MRHYIKDTYGIILLMIVLTMASCTRQAMVPENASTSKELPHIFPDYTEVTVPCNICPLNFMAADGSDAIVARLSCGDASFVYGEDNKVIIDEEEWHSLLTTATGKSINVEVFSRKGDAWTAYKPFNIYVAQDSIDAYISYRLIEPGYTRYNYISIVQRDITSFDERDIYNNKALKEEKYNQCINCHAYQNYGTNNMLFHMRQDLGGTMLVSNGQLKKVDLKTDSTISAGVYPAWHPTLNLVAFSTNKTGQSFHTKAVSKIEVFDEMSDLIIYDVEKNEVSTVSNEKDEFEIFPAWSPDGKTLYYGSAHFVFAENDTTRHETQIINRHKEIKYSIYSRTFDPDSHTFGAPVMVYDAAGLDKSATLQRISPDGKYMIFSLGNYGCFHVWHPEADIYIMDLATKEVRCLEGINSNRSESYPTFSSNGRWIMTDSRRDDSNYTRPYISYFDKEGKCHKAFAVPQRDPERNTLLLKSYNRPEFMKEPVNISLSAFINKAKEDAVKANYK